MKKVLLTAVFVPGQSHYTQGSNFVTYAAASPHFVVRMREMEFNPPYSAEINQEMIKAALESMRNSAEVEIRSNLTGSRITLISALLQSYSFINL